MIKVTVKQAALRRGIKNPYQLAQRLQPTTVEPKGSFQKIAIRLWKGQVIPKLETIDKVAAALGNCDLSELIVRVPNGHTKSRPRKQAAKTQTGANGLAKNSDNRQNNRRNGRRG